MSSYDLFISLMNLNLWKLFHCEVMKLQKNLEKITNPIGDRPASNLEISRICGASIQFLYHQSYIQGN